MIKVDVSKIEEVISRKAPQGRHPRRLNLFFLFSPSWLLDLTGE